MKKLVAIVLFLTIGLAACDDTKDYVVIIHTEYGDMKAILYNETPLHKKNFLELAKSGRYDSTNWHRVIKGFMIQGGNVHAKEGTRESKDDLIPAEFVDKFMHTKGVLAAARQGDQINPEKKSSSVQFYIVHGKQYTADELTTDQSKLSKAYSALFDMPEYDSLLQEYIELSKKRDNDGITNFLNRNKSLCEEVTGIDMDKEIDPAILEAYTTLGGAPHLDGQYTVFGRVVEGLNVIDSIANVETGRMDKPVKDTYMTMEIEMMPKKKITKLYGYEYPDTKED